MRATSASSSVARRRAEAMGRALRAFAALALGLGAALAFAQTEADAELKRLEVALGRINQAQQSVYQQFQMVRSNRIGAASRESRLRCAPCNRVPGTVPELMRYVTARAMREHLLHLCPERLSIPAP